MWEAQTLAPPAQAEWKYVSVRRTAIFLERSIDEGTQWVAFEPNEEPLWAKRAHTRSWRRSAPRCVQGAAPDEAYFVGATGRR